MRQKDVAGQLGVNQDTIRNWEIGRAAPAQWQWPAIIDFLGYAPFSTNGTLRERLKAYRRIHGLSQKRLAALLTVDPSTLWHWGRGWSEPNRHHRKRVSALLGDP